MRYIAATLAAFLCSCAAVQSALGLGDTPATPEAQQAIGEIAGTIGTLTTGNPLIGAGLATGVTALAGAIALMLKKKKGGSA